MAKKDQGSKYTAAIADEILRRIAEGETLSQICRDEGMPPRRTVARWALDDREGFATRYAHARERQIEAWADQITEIAEDGTNDWIERELKSGRIKVEVYREAIERSRLRIETRKWLLSKLKPEKYGDKLNLSGSVEMTMSDAELQSRLTQLLGKAGIGGALGGSGAQEGKA